MPHLKKMEIKGYKSLIDTEICFEDNVSVLLGANGSGKSNLVSFFRMLNYSGTGGLQAYIGQNGTSNSLLSYGRKNTTQIDVEIEFEGNNDTSTKYVFTLVDAAPETLIYTREKVAFHTGGRSQPQEISLGAGHKESILREEAKNNKTCEVLCIMLSRCQFFQFHDTSPTSNIRKSTYIEDSKYLRSDAGNLAAYLYVLKKNDFEYYQMIVDTVRLVFPKFGDFVLEPSASNENYIILNWTEIGQPDYLFGPHQLSDGTLRFMALATLFLQPQEKMPEVIILDEPELGLHPYAIVILASLVKSAAVNSQVILATQSTRLVDEFAPEQIYTIANDKKTGTQFVRKTSEELEEWLEEYSMSELWEKNILGGRPA